MNINFYLERDGEDGAKETVKMHFRNYLEALTNPKAHASTRDYRSKFVDSLLTMATFLGEAVSRELTVAVRDAAMDRAARANQEPGAFVQSLNHAVRCGFPTDKTLEMLREYPLDREKETESGFAALRIKPADYQRAVALLEAANISVEQVS